MLLKDKVALVTGGGQGIGKAISVRLAKEGAHIAVCDINLEIAQNCAKELEKIGVKAAAFQSNVADAKSAEETVNKVIDNFGRVDILVNNAGVTRDTLLMRMKEEDWDLVLNVNLKGTFNFTKAIVRPMMKQQSGAIVNVASVIGLIGNAGQGNYAASKAGVIGLTKSVAKEVASRNIRVNAVAPGFIATAMTDKLPEDIRKKMLDNIPMGRFGSPEDVADVILFLASDLSRYVTGTVVNISGGLVT
jgi:3-oxoacyl-[acyl-carrier protein] reductase